MYWLKFSTRFQTTLDYIELNRTETIFSTLFALIYIYKAIKGNAHFPKTKYEKFV